MRNIVTTFHRVTVLGRKLTSKRNKTNASRRTDKCGKQSYGKKERKIAV